MQSGDSDVERFCHWGSKAVYRVNPALGRSKTFPSGAEIKYRSRIRKSLAICRKKIENGGIPENVNKLSKSKNNGL